MADVLKELVDIGDEITGGAISNYINSMAMKQRIKYIEKSLNKINIRFRFYNNDYQIRRLGGNWEITSLNEVIKIIKESEKKL